MIYTLLVHEYYGLALGFPCALSKPLGKSPPFFFPWYSWPHLFEAVCSQQRPQLSTHCPHCSCCDRDTQEGKCMSDGSSGDKFLSYSASLTVIWAQQPTDGARIGRLLIFCCCSFLILNLCDSDKVFSPRLFPCYLHLSGSPRGPCFLECLGAG